MTHETLRDAHVLVVGGTGTLGQAIVAAAASTGARVTLTSRSAETAAQTAEAHDGDLTGVAYDATDHGTVANLVGAGPYDHVVVTAADLSFDSLTDISSGDLDDLVSSKLLGTMWTAKHLRDHIADDGSLLLISGMLSRNPVQAAPLAAVNGAIESLGRGLAHEWSPLRVNVISPGGVGAAMVGAHEGRPEDVAALALATMANPWINATVLDIHG